MSEEDSRKLFRDFMTLKSNAHLNPNGVGLGLSICKKIVKQLDGGITVKSVLGEGTTFTFYVAADLSPESTRLGLVSSQGTGTGKTKSLPNETINQDLPSEFSHLVNRMHLVFQQFKSREIE